VKLKDCGMGSFYRSKHELIFVFKNGPDRVSSLLATISDASQIHEILMKELREVLEELSRDD
jgi:hypothetical protein